MSVDEPQFFRRLVPTSQEKPVGWRRLGLVLALGGLLVVLDTTVTIVAIAPVVADLDSTLATVQWITTGYLLAVVAVIPLAGWAAKAFGERTTYLCALTVFVLSSVMAAVAWDPASLIGSRVAQGLGGGLLNPVGMAIALHAVPRHLRGRMMSLLGLPVVIGPVLGPPLAGVLIDAASWRWIFAINLPIGLLAIALCSRVLPNPMSVTADAVDRDSRPRLDWFGLVQLSVGAVLLVLGCSMIGEAGRFSLTSIAPLIAGVAMLASFARWAARGAHPIVDVSLLRNRPLGTGAGVLMLFGAGYFGSITILPIYVQAVRGDSAGFAGTLTIPMGLAVGVTLQIATRLVDRIAPRRIVLVGTCLGALGCAALLIATTYQASYLTIAMAATLLGVGSGATLMPTMTLALRDLEGTDTSAGTTLLALLQQLAAGIGVAIVTTVITLRLNAEVPTAAGSGIGALMALPAQTRLDTSSELSGAVGSGYLIGICLCALACVTAMIGVRRDGGAEAQARSRDGRQRSREPGSECDR